MSTAFDAYRRSYEDVVQDSISFSGLKHDFFLEAKIVELDRLFAGHFNDRKPALLDVGCGVGRMHPLLKPIVGEIAGCDPSGESVARAAEDNAFGRYRQSEGTRIPFATAEFDATLAVCVFHHVPVDERLALLSEMRRVTRTGGLTVIIEHNPFNPGTRLAVARCPFDHDAVLLRSGEAAGLLAATGYEHVASRHFLLLPFRNRFGAAVERMTAGLPFGAQYLSWGVAP